MEVGGILHMFDNAYGTHRDLYKDHHNSLNFLNDICHIWLYQNVSYTHCIIKLLRSLNIYHIYKF